MPLAIALALQPHYSFFLPFLANFSSIKSGQHLLDHTVPDVVIELIHLETQVTRVRLPSKLAYEPSNGPNLPMVELWELVF